MLHQLAKFHYQTVFSFQVIRKNVLFHAWAFDVISECSKS